MAFSHDDHIHKGKDFPVKDNRARTAPGRYIKPGPTATVDWDKPLPLVGSHVNDDHFNAMVSAGLQLTVNLAKERGQTSRARKAQRQLNDSTEARLRIRSSWCPTCINYLHNCSCPATAEARGAAAASTSFMDSVYQHMEARENDYREAVDDARRQRRKDKRLQRKANERAARGNS